MKLRENYLKKEHKNLNLTLLLTETRSTIELKNWIVYSERKFYKNSLASVGYRFYKPISKPFNGAK